MSSFLIELHTGEDRGVETYAEDAHKLADTLLTLTSDPVQMQAMTGHNECDLDLEVSVSNGELVAYAVMDFDGEAKIDKTKLSKYVKDALPDYPKMKVNKKAAPPP